MVNEKELFELLREFSPIPAPSHEEDLRVKFCLDWLSGNGIKAYEDKAKNVIIPFGNIEGDGITVFLAHTDVVFPDKEPLPYREEGGKAFCPGIGDNSVHAVQLLLAAREFAKSGITPAHGMLLVLNSCEEGLGNLKGIKQIMADFEGKIARVISFDGSYKSLVTKVVGSERYRITIRTEGGHSFGAFGNSNAIEKMADLICELYKVEVPHIGDSKTTYNVGMISGGTSVNTIAQSAEMLYEFRSDEVECIRLMREKFESIIEKRFAAGIDVEVEVMGIRPCASGVDEKAHAELSERLSKLCSEITGLACPYRSGSTDSNIPMSLGVPSVTVGGYIGGKAHTREEWLDMPSVPVGYRIVENCIFDFAKD